jgi:hypothetical protein
VRILSERSYAAVRPKLRALPPMQYGSDVLGGAAEAVMRLK